MGLGKKAALGAAGMISGLGAAVAYKLDQEVRADISLHAPHLPWSHSGNFDSLDHASIRWPRLTSPPDHQPPGHLIF